MGVRLPVPDRAHKRQGQQMPVVRVTGSTDTFGIASSSEKASRSSRARAVSPCVPASISPQTTAGTAV